MSRSSIFASSLLALLLFSVPMWVEASEPATTFYVSTEGEDTNPGSEKKPFLTVERARDAIRELKGGKAERSKVVLIRDGVYRLTKPLRMESQDGGSGTSTVTYAAYPGERVVISGGVPIEHWRTKSNGLSTAKLPAGVSSFRQLYLDGMRLNRTRYPEEGFLKIKSVSEDLTRIAFTEPLPAWLNAGESLEVVVVQNWSISREIVTAVESNAVTTATPTGWMLHGSCLPLKGRSVFLENVSAAPKRPGQWYVDPAERVVWYRSAIDVVDSDRHPFIAPVAEQLLVVKGTREQPVEHLFFRGIEFAHTAWRLPEIGYGGIQACYYGTKSDGKSPTYAATTAVEFSYARGCRMERCRFLHLGGSALGLMAGCRENVIRTCEFDDIGGNGPMVGHMQVRTPLWTDWADPADAPEGNEISNCYVHRCGQELWGAVGIFDAMAKGTRIVHNEVSDLPYGGISVGYVWNTEKTSQENTLVAQNHVHEVLWRLYDSGAVYTLGYQPGAVISSNLLHGVRRSDYAGGQAANNGIFFDEGSKGIHLEGNIIYDIADADIRYNRSRQDWQTWKDNSLGVLPDQEGFPREIADGAGLSIDARKFLKGE